MRTSILLVFLLLPLAPDAARADEPKPWRAWPKAAQAAQETLEAALNAIPTTESLEAWHTRFCREAHPAGTEADARMLVDLLKALEEIDVPCQRHDFWAYLPTFEGATVEIHADGKVEPLPLREDPIPEDPSVAKDVPPAFNAYSASGDVRAAVVYANYGTKADFEKLAELGISCQGKIVLARYGKNYRGYKAKYAQEAGAIGALLYTDPDDSGYRKGLPYPEGGFATPSYIQRGSIKTLAYAGDPLTPGRPATKDAERLDPKDVALPKIPVQPIGWAAAAKILRRFDGAEVPGGWQGGLPFRYRLTGPDTLQVRVQVKQPRSLKKTANVLGVIEGAVHPEQRIIVGCHLDAWTFGAGDPHAGTMLLYEMARSFAMLAKAGSRPARTIVFANWGCEEFGIIGSTEWCEAQRDDLFKHGVAYINLDMAAMGPKLRSSSGPLLKAVIEDAAHAVPQAGDPSKTAWQGWQPEPGKPVSFGNLGGGSDHVGFQCHVGVPSCSLGGGGSRGVSYHSAYDTVHWYRKVVGGYEPALMLTRVGNVLVSRLANAPLLPYDMPRVFADARRHIDAMIGTQSGAKHPAHTLRQRLHGLEERARALQPKLEAAVQAGRLDAKQLATANRELLALERAWIHDAGLPGRPWYRSLFAATDPYSGYAAWMLPLMRAAHEGKDGNAMVEAVKVYLAVCMALEQRLATLEGLLG